ARIPPEVRVANRISLRAPTAGAPLPTPPRPAAQQQAGRTAVGCAAVDHYFSPAPGRAGRPRSLQVRLRGREVTVQVDDAVFSTGRLDPGTRVLLDHVPDPASAGTLVDLGCGWGPIALAMAAASPQARVCAVDVNQRALEL